jgi:adenine-specific DNA-methyltransferase
MGAQKRAADRVKKEGIHYTPPSLAAFLADVTVRAVGNVEGALRVLDPACGDGGLLVAIVNTLPSRVRRSLTVEGYETDAEELAKAGASLSQLGIGNVILHNRDFLLEEGIGNPNESGGLFDKGSMGQYDLVIANPPYVRTQVMGAKKSQALARRFGLTGRVDLSHAFAAAIASVLRPGGVVGLLTSNRFLTIKSGASLREIFRSQFDVEAVYDLGDTKLFSAAVLPVIVVARKGTTQTPCRSEFHRVYERRNGTEPAAAHRESILIALRESELSGLVETPAGAYQIERGKLSIQSENWTLSNRETSAWLKAVAGRQAAKFGDLAKVRVGIKSTADEVFVRDDWQSFPEETRPEAAVLRPLLTHHEAARWLPSSAVRQVIYPHVMKDGKRTAIKLREYPKAAAYFERHKARLSRRSYVIDGGRKWYEIWVPHNPLDWSKPKIAYPDISEHPKFFFDASGAVIQGDCYWITLNDQVDANWLLLMLAVANSTFITKYYDAVFHNKLYAGRRRFMTQYVEKFPLPDLGNSLRIVENVSKLLREPGRAVDMECEINRQVWEAFGLAQDAPSPEHYRHCS